MNATKEPLLAKRKQFQESLLSWYDKGQQSYPWRTLYAASLDPYPVLVSEIMLQQTRIDVGLPAFKRFMQRFPTVYDLAAATEPEVRQTCRGLGYYRRFHHLHRSAQLCAVTHPPQWPVNAKAWQELPGIGEYTAAALASITLGEPVAAVDGNVIRVFYRLLGQPGAGTIDLPSFKRRLKILGDQIISQNRPGDYNQAVMELGQQVCKKSAPDCSACPVGRFCQTWRSGQPVLSGGLSKAPPAIPTQLRMLVTTDKVGNFYVRPRPEQARFLPGQIGFDTFVLHVDKEFGRDGRQRYHGLWPEGTSRFIGTFKHRITKYQLTIEVFQQELPKAPSGYVKLTPMEPKERLVCNLDRKAYELVCKTSSTDKESTV